PPTDLGWRSRPPHPGMPPAPAGAPELRSSTATMSLAETETELLQRATAGTAEPALAPAHQGYTTWDGRALALLCVASDLVALTVAASVEAGGPSELLSGSQLIVVPLLGAALLAA